MTRASDNAFPSILITEGTEPSAPAAGKQRLYIDSTTHKLKRTDSSGTDVTIEGSSTTIATDTIWDAKGDLVAASAADTGGRLAVGSDGQVLTADSAQTLGVKWATPSGAATFVGARVYRSTTQSITSGTPTAIGFANERFDTDAFHDTVTNNTRLTVPSGKAGKYLIGFTGEFVSNGNQERAAWIKLNGTTDIAGHRDQTSTAGSAPWEWCINTIYDLAVGDYVEAIAYQNSGVSLNVDTQGNRSPEFWIALLGA